MTSWTSGECGVTLNIIDEQTANWSRDEAQDMMTNWLSTGTEFDAVISNNDEMAIGAIQAMKAAGMDMADVIVGGVDATQDALAAMQAGDLDVTVFQDAAGQGSRRPRRGAEAGPRRGRRAEGLRPLPARHPGQHRRLPEPELIG